MARTTTTNNVSSTELAPWGAHVSPTARVHREEQNMAPKSLISKRAVFKGLKIAVAKPLPSGWAEDKTKTFIETRGGTCVWGFDDGVTHVVCSFRQYQKRIALVKKFLETRSKRIKCVGLEWLKQCCNDGRGRLQPTEEFDHGMRRRRMNMEIREEREKIRFREDEKGFISRSKILFSSHHRPPPLSLRCRVANGGMRRVLSTLSGLKWLPVRNHSDLDGSRLQQRMDSDGKFFLLRFYSVPLPSPHTFMTFVSELLMPLQNYLLSAAHTHRHTHGRIVPIPSLSMTSLTQMFCLVCVNPPSR